MSRSVLEPFLTVLDWVVIGIDGNLRQLDAGRCESPPIFDPTFLDSQMNRSTFNAVKGLGPGQQ